MTLKTYLNLCTQVYDLSKPIAPHDDYLFYRSYASAAKGPILEPMCGTGRFLIPLLEEGFNVHGFDASSHMLQALHEKAIARGLDPIVWQGYVEDLHRQEKYGLVLIPSGSFGLIVDRAKALEVLIKISNHLSDDGVLVFEADTRQAEPTQPGVWKGKAWPKNDGKTIIANSLDLPLQDDVTTTIWRYELLEDAKITQTEVEIIKVRRYDPVELKLLLKDAGLKNVSLVKAFDNTKHPDNSDEVIIYECRK